ncbi:methyltransferase domain-containing protein, partial [Mesorhizobium sp. M4B.F.Ca.ET.169.01.1.1]
AFVGAGQQDLAYIDEDIRISDGANGAARYLMEPSPLAKLLQLAEIDASDSVLDVGCGSGYSAALLSRLARSVVALESDPALAETARSTLSSLGCQNVTVITGPLPQGHAAKAP